MEKGKESAIPSYMVDVLTTEHAALQSARFGTISEKNGRASMYLGAVSSSVVALAFIASISESGPIFFAFALVILPVLFLMGFLTFGRLVQIGIADARFLVSINRIRHFYVKIAPEANDYLTLQIHDDEHGLTQPAMQSSAWWQRFLSTAAIVASVNSIIGGVVGAVALGWVAHFDIAQSVLAGILVGGVAFLLHVIVRRQMGRSYQNQMAVRIPTPPDVHAEDA